MPAHALAQAPQTWRRCHPTQEQPLRRRQTLTSRIRRQIGQPPAAASTHRPPNARGKASKRQEGGPPPRPDAPARGPSISPGARQRRHHGSSRRQRNTIERRARARRSLQMAGRGGGGGATPPRRTGGGTGPEPRDPPTPSPRQPSLETQPWRAPPQSPTRHRAGGRASLHRRILPQDNEMPRRRRPPRGLSSAASSGDGEEGSEKGGGARRRLDLGFRPSRP